MKQPAALNSRGLYDRLLDRFGVSINRKKEYEEDSKLPQFSQPENDDGAVILPYTNGQEGVLNYQLSLDPKITSEASLINHYRQVSLFNEPDMAIQEIVNEAIIHDDNKPPIEINLENIDNSILPEATKKDLTEEFNEILRMLNFNKKGSDIFQRWYIDSRIVYHKMVDPKKTTEGIQKLKFLDPRKIRKIKEVEQKIDENKVVRYETKDEYFLYFDTPFQYDRTYGGYSNVTLNALDRNAFLSTNTTAIKINKDSIAYITSGLTDPSTGVTYGYLQKALRPFNQLRWAEDSMIVNRIANSGEKRIIYVDTGKMSPKNAERYMNNIQQKYKNKMTYDAVTGGLKSDPRVMSIQENIWLPRIDGNKTTEIQQVSSNVNFSDIDDVEYFKEKLYYSLRVPPQRFKSEGIQMVLGQQNEVSREELKFTKFVNKLRKQFSYLFIDILRTQVVLKKIMNEEEFDEIAEEIDFNFIEDSYYTEAKEQELLMARIAAAKEMNEMVGKYFSNEYVRKNVLRQTEEDMKRIDAEIKKETSNPQYQDAEEDSFGYGGNDDDGPKGDSEEDSNDGEETNDNEFGVKSEFGW